MDDHDSGSQGILRLRQVAQKTGLSRSTIYKRMRDGTFPPAVPLGGRMVGWRVGDVERFLMNPARYRAPRVPHNVDHGDAGHDGP
ncbi:MAG TPA: AlpA family transcriptional regulator [Paraburkholderia sp.]|jgi:prophage regulatory protein|nr:AlpA family transcriptional regulator [Paraburkholderia sp.]